MLRCGMPAGSMLPQL
ncbi:hypothetical protein E2C01_059796 [Portunus trituberculatus]|uniref:Uncharacterized protein n=1 Tax=Portunus trituberculatus TaxID=210409 RepID=A0A5B7H9F9_PORTR|nr:hypothetical protein [Portunus trituberculatus]